MKIYINSDLNTHGLLAYTVDSGSRHPASLCSDVGLDPQENPIPLCTQYKSLKAIHGIVAATYQNPVVRGRVGCMEGWTSWSF